MGYLVCQRCGGFYKLREGESADDFVSCQCYGPLKYVENLDDELDTKKKLAKGSSFNDESFNDEVIEVSEQTSYHDVTPSDDVKSHEDIKKSSDKDLDGIIESHEDMDSDGDVGSYDAGGVDLDEDMESHDHMRSTGINEVDEGLESVKDSDSDTTGDLDNNYQSDDNGLVQGDRVGLTERSDSTLKSIQKNKAGLKNKSKSDENPVNYDLGEMDPKNTVDTYSYNQIKEPTIKNRAYYRQAYYGDMKPDIKKYKLLKDVDSLISSLKYPDPAIKQEAVQALGVIGNERALNPLEQFIKEETSTLKIYAEIAVNQIKSKKHGFKSKNRNYYRKVNSSKKVENTKIDVIQENRNNLGNEVDSKTVVPPVSHKGDNTSEKFPEIPINEISHESKVEVVSNENNENVSSKPSEPPGLKKTDIKSIIPDATPNKHGFPEDKSLKTNLEDADAPELDTSGSIPEEGKVSDVESLTRDLKEDDIVEDESKNYDLEEDVTVVDSSNSDITPIITDKTYSEDELSIEHLSEESSLLTGSDEHGYSEDKISRSDIELTVEATKSADINLEDDKLDNTNYLGRNIQDESADVKISVEKPSDILEGGSSLEGRTSLEDGFSREITSDIQSPDTKTDTTLNKELPSTQSKLSGFSNDHIDPTNKGTPIRTKEDFDVKTQLTSKTKSSTGSIINKNSIENKATTKENDEDYFIKWLGIKNSDKPFIGFIILFGLSLIIGVVLTMGYK